MFKLSKHLKGHLLCMKHQKAPPAKWEAEWGSQACWCLCQCGPPRSWSPGLRCTPVKRLYLAKYIMSTGTSFYSSTHWPHLLEVGCSANSIVEHWQVEPECQKSYDLYLWTFTVKLIFVSKIWQVEPVVRNVFLIMSSLRYHIKDSRQPAQHHWTMQLDLEAAQATHKQTNA